MNEIIRKVQYFAAKAHEGQTRKYTPEAYIVHPVRVMELCAQHSQSKPVLAAALLHDVLEDTKVTSGNLKEFLLSIMDRDEAERSIALVIELTDVFVKSKYPKLNRDTRKRKEAQRIARTSSDAQTIKYADIIDNCTEIAGVDDDFVPRFLSECRMLLGYIKSGNSALYKQAVEVVDGGLKAVKRTAAQDKRKPGRFPGHGN
jgi:(p)ppGpp synthase/HD superfamily hydrolase